MSGPKSRGLLRYWSIRYFAVVVIGMGLVAAATMLYIQRTNLDRQYSGMEMTVREIADEASKHGGSLPEDPGLGEYVIRLNDRYDLHGNRSMLFVLDGAGNVIQQHSSAPPEETERMLERLPAEASKKPGVSVIDPLPGEETYLVAVHPIGGLETGGYAMYMMPRDNLMRGLIEFRWMRLLAVATLIVAGWTVIYLMTRGFVEPIRSIVTASREIVAGNYRIRFDPRRHHIKEIDELMTSIQEMAERLDRMEALRTQLLAGVTHELRTPIASISGLLQAMRDGVVEGEDAKLFLNNGLKQTQRLHKMVEDLLEFNSFASNSVAVKKEPCNLRRLLQETIDNWHFSQESGDRGTKAVLLAGDEGREARSDPLRIEQIVVNLLNNAKDAMSDGGEIRIRLEESAFEYRITVQDTGCGIPLGEREDVFVPFFRGSGKKQRTAGLGLGLPFSRLIARSLGGDLTLTASGPEGTTFALTIPR